MFRISLLVMTCPGHAFSSPRSAHSPIGLSGPLPSCLVTLPQSLTFWSGYQQFCLCSVTTSRLLSQRTRTSSCSWLLPRVEDCAWVCGCGGLTCGLTYQRVAASDSVPFPTGTDLWLVFLWQGSCRVEKEGLCLGSTFLSQLTYHEGS